MITVLIPVEDQRSTGRVDRDWTESGGKAAYGSLGFC